MLQFNRGEATMLYKTSHDPYGPYQEADFLKLKFKRSITQPETSVEIPIVKPQPVIDASRINGIKNSLLPLMPANKRIFWEKL